MAKSDDIINKEMHAAEAEIKAMGAYTSELQELANMFKKVSSQTADLSDIYAQTLSTLVLNLSLDNQISAKKVEQLSVASLMIEQTKAEGDARSLISHQLQAYKKYLDDLIDETKTQAEQGRKVSRSLLAQAEIGLADVSGNLIPEYRSALESKIQNEIDIEQSKIEILNSELAKMEDTTGLTSKQKKEHSQIVTLLKTAKGQLETNIETLKSANELASHTTMLRAEILAHEEEQSRIQLQRNNIHEEALSMEKLRNAQIAKELDLKSYLVKLDEDRVTQRLAQIAIEKKQQEQIDARDAGIVQRGQERLFEEAGRKQDAENERKSIASQLEEDRLKQLSKDRAAAAKEAAEIEKRDAELLQRIRDRVFAAEMAKQNDLAAAAQAGERDAIQKMKELHSEALAIEKERNSAIKEQADVEKKQAAANKKVVDGLLAFANRLFEEIDKIIRKNALDLSTDYASSSKILLENLKGTLSSFFSGGALVRPEESAETRASFGKQFGGVLREDAAGEFAQTAKSFNVAPAQYISSLRALVGIAGGISGAQTRIKSTTESFIKAGLTGKDAAEFIEKNTNLMARNGTRFAKSLEQAAIEAKKAGYSLQSIEGFGDRIVGDFEGFLEDATAMAAMGMQFDVSSLAEAAVSGDTDRLKNELQSQLQAQGLSLENMNRAQRMQLEKTVGMPLEEALKIQKAPETAASVSAQLDMDAAKLQSDSSKIFEKAVFGFQAAVVGIGAVVALARGVDLLKAAGIGSRISGFGGASAPKTPIAPTMAAGGSASALGGMAGGGLSGIASGLASFANPAALAGLAAVTAAVIGLGYAFKVAGPAMEPFGKMLRSILGGMGDVISSVVTAMGELVSTLSNLNPANTALMGAAMVSMAAGLTTLGAAALVSSPGLLALAGMKKLGILPTDTTEAKEPSGNVTAATETQPTQAKDNMSGQLAAIAIASNVTNQKLSELIRQATVSNQKLEAMAKQIITVNMDGQRVGNIIKRSAMVASTGASTARSNG